MMKILYYKMLLLLSKRELGKDYEKSQSFKRHKISHNIIQKNVMVKRSIIAQKRSNCIACNVLKSILLYQYLVNHILKHEILNS